MDKNIARSLRKVLFLHLDGIAITSTISSMYNNGVIQYILVKKTFSLQEILDNFPSNDGYINIALRLLQSQGWLKKIDNNNYSLTEKGVIILGFSKTYSKIAVLINKLCKFRYKLFSSSNDFSDEFVKYANYYNKIKNDISYETKIHFQGLLVGPALVALGMNGKAEEYLKSSSISITDLDNYPLIKSIIGYFQTINFVNENYNLTDVGEFYFKRASAYGVTVSYLPMFFKQDEILFGNPDKIWERDIDGNETHVDRTMNVWGSGGAHSTYFNKIDEIICNIFNQPLSEQPIGISDMGCGDGTLLKHLYNIVKNKTLRGKNLREYPLIIVGADFNKDARIASKKTLDKEKIKNHIIHADISNPENYASELNIKYNIDLDKLLNVRSFLDHNRIYSKPQKSYENINTTSTGAYSFRGRLIPNKELEQNLVEHLYKWSPYVKQFGLLVLELHCLPPNLTAKNLGITTATAYESTHGYSDQYIVELETYLIAAYRAGLIPDPKNRAKFPDNELATISINLFKNK